MSETLEMFLRECSRALTNSETPLLDARMIAQVVLDIDDAGLIMAARDVVSSQDKKNIAALVERRAKGEPVAYITGYKEFRSLNFEMYPGVLVPRPDSETLIDAVEAARSPEAPLRFLDLGVGSGCLLVTLLKSFRNATGLGVDRNIAAARLAKENASRLGVDSRAAFFCGEWCDALESKFDVIISNPPYIRTGDAKALASDIRDHEDNSALFAGPDGLDAYKEVLDAAGRHLSQDGLLVLELGAGQEQPARELVEAHLPKSRIYTQSDLAGIARALIADNAR